MSFLNIGVLGAGVVGLTTALEVQKEIRNAQVTIIAEKFSQDTTSDGAAGFFQPSVNFSGPTEDITKEWIKNSFDYYSDLMKEDAGIRPLTGYFLSNMSKDAVQNYLLEKVLPVYRDATEDELSTFPIKPKYGAYLESLLIEGRHFLPWAMAKFSERGGVVQSRPIGSFSELQGKFNVVMNCSGLGSIGLCGDRQLVPIRGQILKVFAPWVKHFYVGDNEAYIFPQSKGLVTLGGTRNFNNFDLNPCPFDTAAIMDKCTKLVPSLTSASILRTWVGLRPHRGIVRVEPEIIGGLRVVHNYGHCGYGVTSAPGTAIHATRHLKDVLATRNKL